MPLTTFSQLLSCLWTVVLVCVVTCAGEDSNLPKRPVFVGTNLCQKSICGCYPGVNNAEVINCTCSKEEKELYLEPLSGPMALKKLQISNCDAVSFQPSSLTFSTVLHTLQVTDVTNLTIGYSIFANPLHTVTFHNIAYMDKIPSHLFHLSQTKSIVFDNVSIGEIEEMAFSGVSPQKFSFHNVSINTIKNDAISIAASPNGTFEIKNSTIEQVMSDGISVGTGSFHITGCTLNRLHKFAIYASGDVFELLNNKFTHGLANTSLMVNATESLITGNEISFLHAGALEAISGKYYKNHTLMETPTLKFSENKIAYACQMSLNIHLDSYTLPDDVAQYTVSIQNNQFPCVCNTLRCNTSLAAWLVQQVRMSGSQQKKQYYTNILANNQCYNTSCEVSASVVDIMFDTKLQCIVDTKQILQQRCNDKTTTTNTNKGRFKPRPPSQSHQNTENTGRRPWDILTSALHIMFAALFTALIQ